MEECEVKFVNIDPEQLEKQILELGGVKQFDRIFKRVVLDYPDWRLNTDKSWVRVRDEGDRVTLSFKKRLEPGEAGVNDKSMIEHEVVVSSFEETIELLHQIGMIDKFYEENRRVQFKLDNVELDIDYWPQLKPYLEIEADTWDQVDAMIAKLGLDSADKKIYSTHQIYAENGIEEFDYSRITFEEMIKRND
jgi:adenylate cyclase class 2